MYPCEFLIIRGAQMDAGAVELFILLPYVIKSFANGQWRQVGQDPGCIVIEVYNLTGYIQHKHANMHALVNALPLCRMNDQHSGSTNCNEIKQ
ncbi:hypothetical protein D3C78_1040790 [compost metagenome]